MLLGNYISTTFFTGRKLQMKVERNFLNSSYLKKCVSNAEWLSISVFQYRLVGSTLTRKISTPASKAVLKTFLRSWKENKCLVLHLFNFLSIIQVVLQNQPVFTNY